MPCLVLFIIFSFTDIDSLIQFKRVNKFYYAIITSFLKDPNFISQRLKKFSNDYAIICDPARGKLVNENGKIQRMVEMPFE